MKNKIEQCVFALSVVALTTLAACSGGGSGSGSGSADTPTSAEETSETTAPYAPALYAVPLSCADGSAPIAAGASNGSVTENIPTDFDASANPAPTSTVHFSVLMPAHCRADTFPLILHSHGYGGNRLAMIAADGTLKPMAAHFSSINSLVQALPHYGYIVISYDQRGHGDSYAANARIIDPAAEVQDARAILDWAYDILPV
ncbi:MAG: ABC-2 type transport system ATP-binding protein [Janthinobacterium sp.]|jgi:ABC-2 type transport system ATP-binding protein